MSDFKRLAKTLLGSFLEVVRPGIARDIDSGSDIGSQIRQKHWIRHARQERARWRGDHATVGKTLAGYWQGSAADRFYDTYTNRFQDWFLGPHHVIIDQLVDMNRARPFRTLVEIGCGDGRVLDHCAGKLPGLDRLVGLDINPSIITRDRRTYAENPRLEFVNAHAMQWLEQNLSADTVILTYGGVLEYFTEAELTEMFELIRRRGGGAVALVEPVAPEHDLSAQPHSFVFGSENSFSHNHPALLKQAGFTIVFQQEMHLGMVRWMLALARTNPENQSA